MLKKVCELIIGIGKTIDYHYENIVRSRVDYFNYDRLARVIYLYSFRNYFNIYFYGLHRILKKKFNIRRIPSNYLIEHGVYFSDIQNEQEIYFCKNPHFITMGQQRLEFLHQIGIRNVTSIGPYILYSDYFKSRNELSELKDKLGRTLLVFPSHSIENVTAVYEVDLFISEIERYSKSFDSVLVCMYWKDILDGRHIAYKNKGYTIVTAGHRCDAHFLPRLKDLIYLSDMTMSNALGTHIGYCISMGKPHYLFNQDYQYEGSGVSEENKFSDLDTFEKRKQLFSKLFGAYDETIREDQLQVVKYYWGDF